MTASIEDIPSNPSDLPSRSEAKAGGIWRMADQYFLDGDVEVDTKPYGDGYVMTIRIDDRTRRVFFDPAGRITHVLTGR